MFGLLPCVLSDSSAAGSEASDGSADSVVVSTKACASPSKTSGVNAARGMTVGVVTTTHRVPDHEPPLLRLAPKTSPERLVAAIATTSSRASNFLFMLILKSLLLVENTEEGESTE